MSTCDRMCHGCPFDFFTEATEQAQNFGCLPTPREIVAMRVDHGKTWACHSDPAKPCTGALNYLSDNGHPYKVIDPALVSEADPWNLYTETRS